MSDGADAGERIEEYSSNISRLRYDGRIEEALEVCCEAVEKFPYNNFFYKLQGDLFAQKGDFKQAGRCYLGQLKHLAGKPDQVKTFARFYKRLEKHMTAQQLSDYQKEISDAIFRGEIAKSVEEQLIHLLGTEFALSPELKEELSLTNDDRNLQKVRDLVNKIMKDKDFRTFSIYMEYRIGASERAHSSMTDSFFISAAERIGMCEEALRLIEKKDPVPKNPTIVRTLLRICRKQQDYTFAERLLSLDAEFILDSDFNIQYELVYYFEYKGNPELLMATLKKMRNSAESSVPIARTLYNFYLRFNMFDEAKEVAGHIRRLEGANKGNSAERRIEEQYESEQGIWSKLRELVSEQEHNRQMIAMRDLIKGFSHELGQPITNIRYSIQLYQMKERLGRGTQDNGIRELLDLILYQTERIGNMLARFRPIVSSRSKEESFRVYDRVRLVFEDLDSRLRAQNIDYSVEGDECVELWGDPVQFEQIFYNLILNSMQAIAAKKRNGYISVRIECKNKSEVVIIFQDDGPGIAPENAKKVFEPFFSTKDPSSENGGEGLGLFIVWNILKMFNGRIELNTQHQSGAEFEIIIAKPKGGNGR